MENTFQLLKSPPKLVAVSVAAFVFKKKTEVKRSRFNFPHPIALPSWVWSPAEGRPFGHENGVDLFDLFDLY